MSSNRGKRYDEKPKLNKKKVIGVIVAIAVIAMMIISIIDIVKNSGKNVEVKTNYYYTAFRDGKFGVINNSGEIVIEPTYDEVIYIPNNSKPIFIIMEIDDAAGTYRTKVINEKNEEIFTEYEKIEAIDNIDSKGNMWFEDNVLRVAKNGKYGIINFNNQEVLPCEYEEITALDGTKGNFVVKKDGKVGLVNEAGQTIINTEYQNILTLKEGYKSEYIVQNEEGKYGIINTAGTVLVELNYDEVKYLGSTHFYAVKTNDVWNLFDTEENKVLIEGGYDSIEEAKSENIIIVKDGKYGVVSKENETKIEPEYQDLKYAFSIYYIAKKDDKYGIINLENETVKDFEFENITYIENGGFIIADKSATESVILDNNLGQKTEGIISDLNIDKGYIRVYTNNEYKYFNFKLEEKSARDVLTENTIFLSKKDGKYGYIDKSGNVVVDYIYDDGTEQNKDGYAAVKKDGVWGSVDKAGVETLSPSVNLDDSLYFDFIGTWHLAKSGLYYEK